VFLSLKSAPEAAVVYRQTHGRGGIGRFYQGGRGAFRGGRCPEEWAQPPTPNWKQKKSRISAEVQGTISLLGSLVKHDRDVT